MGHRFQFEQAVELLAKLNKTDSSDETYDVREAMEVIILDHFPTKPQDAASILDALIVNIDAGPRLDGRDIKALANLRRWSLGLVDTATDGQSIRAGAAFHV